MQVPPSQSQRSLSAIGSLHTKKNSDSLSHKFRDILEKLDQAVALSAKETVGTSQHPKWLLPYAQQLEDIFIHLRVWAEDLNIEQPNGREGFPPKRGWTTLDCLDILDTSCGAAATALQKTLNEMAMDTTNVSRIFNMASGGTNEAR